MFRIGEVTRRPRRRRSFVSSIAVPGMCAATVAANMNLVGDNATPTDRLQPAQLGVFFVDVAMDEATPVPAG